MNSSSSLVRIGVDTEQFRFVLCELASNARAAMPAGGKFRLRTENVLLTGEFVSEHPGSKPGSHVLLEVSDTGSGMPPEVQRNLFEPFFSTESRALRTGMGLATVYGIVKQSRGNLYVKSEMGRGTTFAIYMPRVEEVTLPTPGAEAVPEAPAAQRETSVLLVEDDAGIRQMIGTLMRQRGFIVRTAADAGEALRLTQGTQENFDLLVTDISLPGLDGRELARRLLERRPGLRVLFTSGFPRGEAKNDFPVGEQSAFLQKPYSLKALLGAIRSLLTQETTRTVAGEGDSRAEGN